MSPHDSTKARFQPGVAAGSHLRNWMLTAALLLLGCFGWLAHVVRAENGLAWDPSALQAIHRYASPARDNLMVIVTDAGDARTVIIVAMLWALGLVAFQRRNDARFLARCIIGTVVLGFVAKSVVYRTRPHLWISPAPETDFGFPSGHTMDSLALAFAIVLISWRTRWRWTLLVIGTVYVLAVAFSRLYLGVHYPSDVLGGWALALAWLIALSAFRGSVSQVTVPNV